MLWPKSLSGLHSKGWLLVLLSNIGLGVEVIITNAVYKITVLINGGKTVVILGPML
jgi:hypothetical protein